MISSPAEIIARSKAIKVLTAKWKKNLDLRQKALVLLQLNTLQKLKRQEIIVRHKKQPAGLLLTAFRKGISFFVSL